MRTFRFKKLRRFRKLLVRRNLLPSPFERCCKRTLIAINVLRLLLVSPHPLSYTLTPSLRLFLLFDFRLERLIFVFSSFARHIISIVFVTVRVSNGKIPELRKFESFISRKTCCSSYLSQFNSIQWFGYHHRHRHLHKTHLELQESVKRLQSSPQHPIYGFNLSLASTSFERLCSLGTYLQLYLQTTRMRTCTSCSRGTSIFRIDKD